MLGFLHITQEESLGYKKRLYMRLQKDYGTQWEQKSLFSHPVFLGEHKTYPCLSEKRKRERLYTLVSMLQQRGVSKVLLSENSLQQEIPHMKRADAQHLYGHLAGKVGAFVAEKTGDTAYCQISSLGSQEEQAILHLAKHYRYLMIDAGRDTENVCQALRKAYGLPVVSAPSDRQIKSASFALLWKQKGRRLLLDNNCLVFSPMKSEKNHQGGREIKKLDLETPKTYQDQIPQGFPLHPILSEALKRGCILGEKLKIHGMLLDN